MLKGCDISDANGCSSAGSEDPVESVSALESLLANQASLVRSQGSEGASGHT